MENQIVTTPEQEIQEHKSRYDSLIVQGRELKVIDNGTKVKALELVRELNIVSKQMKERKDYFTKDLKKHVKKIEGNYTPYEKVIKEVVGKDSRCGLRGQIGDYETKCESERLKTEENLRAKQQKEYDNEVLEANKEGKIAPPPPPPVTVEATKEKNTSYRDEPDYQVVDINLIPSEYLILDDKKVKGVIKAGIKNIPGLRIFMRKIPIIREEKLEDM